MKKNSKGYSLIEVLAAFAIISIAILPIMSMYPTIFRQNKSATDIEEASRIAFTIVDYIKARGYTNLTLQSPKGLRDKVVFNENKEEYLKYKLINDSGSATFHTKDYKLDKDLGFTTANGAIFFNSKGLKLGDDNTVVAVKMVASNVELLNAKFINPITDIESNIVYGDVTDKFITGRVIIGWGKTITDVEATTDDAKVVLKEKVYGVNYIITPKLRK